MNADTKPALVLTVGHSNRSIEDFLALLGTHDVRLLAARDVPVEHIFSLTSRKPHALTSFAVVRDGLVMYPAPADANYPDQESFSWKAC
jgi:hypothetical protein